MELPWTRDVEPARVSVALKIAGVDAARAGTMPWTKAGILIGQSTVPGAEENTGAGKTNATTDGTLTSIEVNSLGRKQALESGCPC